ncbi:leukocyte-associated immunoglobulin-like receptor 1 [Phodopus roborovskii]|uniref:leukocyte-associated immunoglobulin-like receptor 1 n=1 Tax=Phodopus roborovskii TaxID=109678 RepID=UPI0021E4E621|nr:leukocyte-associated immunoglobulin-like receptor 1 [Phodopus roborovskii]
MTPGRGSWADPAGSLGAVRGAGGAGFAGLPGAGARRAGGGDWGGGGAPGSSVLPLAATGGNAASPIHLPSPPDPPQLLYLFRAVLTGTSIEYGMTRCALCLGQRVNTEGGSVPRPSISAEPGRIISQGRFVTIVCSNPSGYDLFRLEKKDQTVVENVNTSHSVTEARFRLGPVNENTAGPYTCIYWKGSIWSPRSETLELIVTREVVTQAPEPGPAVTSAGESTELGKTTLNEETHKDNHDTSWLKTNGIYILIGVSVVFLFCLLLLLFCFHSRRRQKKQGPPNSKSQQQQRPQKRLSLVTNGLENTSDVVTDDRLPEDRRAETQVPVAGGLQEVTYAQLDHHALTQRTAGAVTPQSTDAKPESSTYAAIIRC